MHDTYSEWPTKLSGDISEALSFYIFIFHDRSRHSQVCQRSPRET